MKQELQDSCSHICWFSMMLPRSPLSYTGRVLVQGAKMWKHGFAVFGQARVTPKHVPQNTCCRNKPTLPLHDYKRVSASIHHRTQEHMELQLDQHFAPMDSSCSLHKAANHIVYRIGNGKKNGSKKAQK